MIDFESSLRTAYNRLLRHSLPQKIGVYNGVAVRRPRLLDRTDVFPDYEAALIDQIERSVTDGDDVVVIGGGLGVSSVYAARLGATATVYEASPARVATIEETVELNGVEERVTVRSGAVGTVVDVSGSAAPEETISASSLPDCDVLILDCEGAEAAILESMEIRPSCIIVETHPMFEAPPEDIHDTLSDLGYDIVDAVDEATVNGIVTILSATGSAD